MANGRNRNRKSHGGEGTSKKLEGGSRVNRLRRREEERASKREANRRRLGKKPLASNKFAGHEATETKYANKRRLEVARLERLVTKLEAQLRDYRPPVQEPKLDPELKRKRRRRDFYDLDTSHWKITGAARPAASLPGAWGSDLANERDAWVPGEDLFEKLGGGERERDSKGAFYDGPEPCREFLDASHQLAQVLHYDINSKMTKEARAQYERCLALDPADHVMAHRGLVRLLLDAGEADQARAIIDRFPEDRGCDMTWSLAAIEFVSWSVLKEAGSSQELADAALEKAYEANPFLAWYIAYRDIFEEVVEHSDEITEPSPGSVEEAFWYMLREAGLWASLKGSADWVAKFLLRKELLPPDPNSTEDAWSTDDLHQNDSSSPSDASEATTHNDPHVAEAIQRGSQGESDEDRAKREARTMFAGMFETAVAMAAEAAEERLHDDHGREATDSGDDSSDGEDETPVETSDREKHRRGDGSDDSTSSTGNSDSD